MSETNKDTVRRVNAAFAASSVEGFLQECTEDVTWNMVGDKTVSGKDAIQQWMASMPQQPPDFTVDALVGDGDVVVAYGDMTMKDQDGAVAPYAYCDAYRFRGDKIAELRSYVIKTKAT